MTTWRASSCEPKGHFWGYQRISAERTGSLGYNSEVHEGSQEEIRKDVAVQRSPGLSPLCLSPLPVPKTTLQYWQKLPFAVPNREMLGFRVEEKVRGISTEMGCWVPLHGAARPTSSLIQKPPARGSSLCV